MDQQGELYQEEVVSAAAHLASGVGHSSYFDAHDYAGT
jgi:hypothetical protein